ncbi:MAG TPA: hypothetical protein VFC24_13420 [Casimicrobiaceae bacterium]|nr:hypothetical protein [Casimicrobiaceae bacterium]
MNTWRLAVVACAMLAGCASTGPQLANADRECVIAPAFTANAVSPGHRQPTELEQRDAENQLASTPYYRRNLERRPESTIVQARRDCY